jgi:metallophosphoesterase (TIGR00282 family)
MRILCIGDVTSPKGVEHLRLNLWRIRKANKIDFCIVNAENASVITGASARDADTLFAAGADCLTGGNHTLRNKTVYTYLDDTEAMLRPLNFGDSAPGHGYAILDCNGYKIMVINVMGNVGIEPVLDNPYPYIDRALERERGRYDFAVMDVHAEATGEKGALGYAYDGRISVIFGTHTHVPTCDQIILPGGTGYITDVGMCGETGGVLGMDPAIVVKQLRTRMPIKLEPATGAPRADGVIFDLDERNGKVRNIERISF